MKYTSLVFFGISLLLLKSEAFQANRSFYKFPTGACYLLENSNWTQVKDCSSSNTYEMSSADNELCLYELKREESLEEITKKLGFLRPVEEVKLSLTKTGRLMPKEFIRRGNKLLFYNRDILRSSDKNLCRKPDKVDMYNSFYAFSYPATFYVMKPYLSKINEEQFDDFEEERAPALLPSTIEARFTKENKMSVRPGLFFESFEGTQKSNGSRAEIINELSPFFDVNYRYDLSRNWKLNFNVGAELHQFDDRVGLLRLSNDSIVSFGLAVTPVYRLSRYIDLFGQVAGYEDLYYFRESASNLRVDKDIVPRVGFGFRLSLLRIKSFALDIVPFAFYDFEGSEFEGGSGFDIPFAISVDNESYRLHAKLGYNAREKELTDLELDYQRYYLEILLGFDL